MKVMQAGTAHEAFVNDAWLRSFRDSWFAGPIYNEDYYDVYRKTITRLRARPGVTTVVCVAEDDPDVILGFACLEPPGIIHYVYVKDVFRRNGVATKLVKEGGVRGAIEYTFRTQAGHKALANKNAIFNPYRARDVPKGSR